jgi:hypothetical protein
MAPRPLFIDLAHSDQMSVTLVHPTTAPEPLFIDLTHSDRMSVILVHPTTALGPLLIDLAHSDQMSVTLVRPTTAPGPLFIDLAHSDQMSSSVHRKSSPTTSQYRILQTPFPYQDSIPLSNCCSEPSTVTQTEKSSRARTLLLSWILRLSMQ